MNKLRTIAHELKLSRGMAYRQLETMYKLDVVQQFLGESELEIMPVLEQMLLL